MLSFGPSYARQMANGVSIRQQQSKVTFGLASFKPWFVRWRLQGMIFSLMK
jgi:hypothetical protein